MRPETRRCSKPLLPFQPPNGSSADIDRANFVKFHASFDSFESLLLSETTGGCPVVTLGVKKHSGHVNEGMPMHGMEFHGSPTRKFWHTESTCAVK